MDKTRSNHEVTKAAKNSKIDDLNFVSCAPFVVKIYIPRLAAAPPRWAFVVK
jgi:hypothetical protein